MKNILKLLALSSLFLVLLGSCKKDEYKDYFMVSNTPVLSAKTNASPDSVKLNYADSSKIAVHLSWTNPNYQFTTGVSSQDVNYQVQIDTVGSDFTNPNMKVISVSKDLSYSITEAELNGIMLNQLGLKERVPYQLEMRVISSMGTNAAIPLVSNTFKASAAPYAIPPKVKLPPSGKLFITGNATKGDWQVGGDPSSIPTDQEFTKVTPTDYEITIDLIGGNEYLLVPVAGSWDHKYACMTTADQSSDGGNFGYDLSDNFPGPATSGTYKITVNFQRGIYTVVKQ